MLGGELARMLGARVGDKVTVVAPGGQVTPAGVVPRLKQMSVVGIFDSGHYEYDSTLAFIHIDDVADSVRRVALAGKAGESTREDLVRQLSKTFAAHLDPSARRALLLEFDPVLRESVMNGTVKFDLQEVQDLWDELADNQLADRILGYMDGKPGTAAHDVITIAKLRDVHGIQGDVFTKRTLSLTLPHLHHVGHSQPSAGLSLTHPHGVQLHHDGHSSRGVHT